MFIALFGWEIFAETVPVAKPFLDWHLSMCENHLWLGHIHVAFNRVKNVA